ncbi:nucleotide sugar dehydrogenase [Ciceribacter sp. RN22]|uniref:nucleotide sugar dehydrogenase n=1 Tax=Ciceribacter sp. RN22 TaxID=2954932 RepID=UPI0020939D8C|nr:nucleotide sugar dehydrogenase [Ciceribacter sp. RN22]MCO6177016.1 nucleotide sugar dehydrogenase [Ciceribacter sp. RN22]
MLYQPTEKAFHPTLCVPARPSVSVVGLGYVGAVSTACLAGLGHRVIGVDVDPVKVRAIAEGRSPIHENDLERLLSQGVEASLISATDDLAAAVSETDITFVSVGTPTAEDGGCDDCYIRAAARSIGEGLRRKGAFHVVVMRCSIPPGTTMGVMVPEIEASSGLKAGHDFGVCFNPEFLREGVAVADFHTPPKTVIGVTDSATASLMAQLYADVDANPIITSIEVAEMVKYVDNVWHATKVTFANEVGRLCKPLMVDSHEVMEIFVRDTKLNLSPYYLTPGFAYGGSCLPKEVRAVTHIAGKLGVDLPLIAALDRSNAAQITEAARLVKATGARKVAVLGLAFKSGTDDLRESPILEVMAELLEAGVAVVAHDPAITAETRIEAQLAYVAHGSKGLGQLATSLGGMLAKDAATAVAEADAVIVTQAHPPYRALTAATDKPVIDVARLWKSRADQPANLCGIGW